MNDKRKCIEDLIAAAKPFTSGDVVDETSGTIPLMEALRKAIEQMQKRLDGDDDE